MKWDALEVCAFVIAGACLGFIVGMVSGTISNNNDWRINAVAHGAAEYITDKEGRPQWQWKQQPKQETP